MDLLEDSIVDQDLGGQRRQQGDGDPQAEAAAGAVERPPQADGERRQRQRQLHVVGKVHFLMWGGSRTRLSSNQIKSRNVTTNHSPAEDGGLKDTALAWLMPTNTATQRITLDHSRFNR